MEAVARVEGASHDSHELDELPTVDDVAGLLRVSKSRVSEHMRSRAVRSGHRLAHVKIGKCVPLRPKAVRFLERRCRQGDRSPSRCR